MSDRSPLPYRYALLAMCLTGLMGACSHHNDMATSRGAMGDEGKTGATSERSAPKPRAQARSGAGASYRPAVAAGMSVTEQSFPTGDRRTSSVLLHQVMPSQVMAGAPYPVEYHVTNLTNAPQSDVVITASDAQNMAIVNSDPKGIAGAGTMKWVLGDLAPGQTRIIKANASSNSLGAASNCLTVSTNNLLCATTNVVKPDLLLVKKTNTREGSICDEYTLTYEVSNPGSGHARNVRVQDNLPDCMTTQDGKRAVAFTVGDLGPGERKVYNLKVKGVSAGNCSSAAVATADGGLRSESDAPGITMRQPALRIACSGRDREFIGRPVRFTYTVTNPGDYVAENVVVTAQLPGGSNVLSASDGGRPGAGGVVWQLGSLAPGANREVRIELSGDTAGQVRTTARATGDCVDPPAVSDACVTSLEGIPAILLEVIDDGDPSPIGDVVDYTISVTNQGSAPDTNIVIRAILPPQLEYVSDAGATQGRVSGQTITFAPVASLPAKQKVQWRIKARTRAEGDVRFQVTMNSDELTGPVEETEATQLYR